MGQRKDAFRRITRVTARDSEVVSSTRSDSLTVEEPLQIRIDGRDFTTTMRTPGNDFELIHGLLHAEGIIEGREAIASMRYCAGATGEDGRNTYNTVDVDLIKTPGQQGGFLPIRNVDTTSACGICGTASVDQILRRSRFAIEPVHPSAEFVLSLPRKLAEAQRSFRKTGGIHAAAAITGAGDVVAVREDVGRHNAADKVIGSLVMADALPASGMFLVMSSRASFELVHKAVLAGFSGLVAVSAATSLAVDLARESGLFLTGFTRDDRFNVYSPAEYSAD